MRIHACIGLRVVLWLCSQEQVDNLREVQALKRLNPHPNIIKLIEVILYVNSKANVLSCSSVVAAGQRNCLSFVSSFV